MDRINKNLLKIPNKQRKILLAATEAIQKGELDNLDVKKLKNSKDLFRVRVGKYRIVLKTRVGQNPAIVDISKRDERTYGIY